MKFSGASIGIVMVSSIINSSNATTHPLQRPIQIKNDSGRKTEIYWIGPSGQMVLQSPGAMASGKTLTLDSYVNHTFFIKEAPDESGTCNGGTTYASPSLAPCMTASFTVNDRDDLVIHILEDMKVEVKDSSSKAKQITSTITSNCQMEVNQQIKANAAMNPNEAIEAFVSCAQPLVANKVEELNKEIKEQASLRTELAGKWEDYTCAAFDLPTTTPEKISIWNYRGQDHVVGVLLDRDTAKIHYVKNFITPEECSAIEAAAAPRLHSATVADGAGGSEIVKSRKALQAGIRVPWDKEEADDPIAAVSRRLYTYINDATGYGIQEAGQEDIMSIQYTGRGLNDTEPDRYMPHCDGQCDGLTFQPAGRVATMVMYCETPLKGGATNFRNVGIHIVPEAGTAAFFSYLGSDGQTDDHLTEHSCCPVLEGNKKIAVQWLRLGVDEENPWSSFNTLNVKIGSEEE
ncbi:hypothetical protein ACHAW5_004288 [Stephanodiscus triporus]|uniref:Prolyl 4-hydroxylase alpha subunit domain-containing protein n=1 Tax=Stephanodiscus triporus TaxID=2934178 RepID=A0ABD3MPW5_9STRA